MDMTGEYKIAAPRERVWAALNDPDILRQAIPGCEELNKLSDTELEGAARAKIGPVSARFKGKVTLSELNPPESYVLTGEGSGGAAGFAKGEAKVVLTADGDATTLRYTVKATIGGKPAQLGQRLIDGAAKKIRRVLDVRRSRRRQDRAAHRSESRKRRLHLRTTIEQSIRPADVAAHRHHRRRDPRRGGVLF
jgi:carbon monoxide dehydrogenase subunit G